MKEEHRELIKKCQPRLIETIVKSRCLEVLIDQLEARDQNGHYGLTPSNIIEIRGGHQTNEAAKVRTFLDILTTRGENAFDRFIKAIKDSHEIGLIEILNSELPPDQQIGIERSKSAAAPASAPASAPPDNIETEVETTETQTLLSPSVPDKDLNRTSVEQPSLPLPTSTEKIRTAPKPPPYSHGKSNRPSTSKVQLALTEQYKYANNTTGSPPPVPKKPCTNPSTMLNRGEHSARKENDVRRHNRHDRLWGLAIFFPLLYSSSEFIYFVCNPIKAASRLLDFSSITKAIVNDGKDPFEDNFPQLKKHKSLMIWTTSINACEALLAFIALVIFIRNFCKRRECSDKYWNVSIIIISVVTPMILIIIHILLMVTVFGNSVTREIQILFEHGAVLNKYGFGQLQNDYSCCGVDLITGHSKTNIVDCKEPMPPTCTEVMSSLIVDGLPIIAFSIALPFLIMFSLFALFRRNFSSGEN
uniref:CARD domain-containing protein n=1 Tax=Plectus sambesii TaxID=2011161 RepID=A0A914XAT6_9BILA